MCQGCHARKRGFAGECYMLEDHQVPRARGGESALSAFNKSHLVGAELCKNCKTDWK